MLISYRMIFFVENWDGDWSHEPVSCEFVFPGGQVLKWLKNVKDLTSLRRLSSNDLGQSWLQVKIIISVIILTTTNNLVRILLEDTTRMISSCKCNLHVSLSKNICLLIFMPSKFSSPKRKNKQFYLKCRE